jgi:hypothetical protein
MNYFFNCKIFGSSKSWIRIRIKPKTGIPQLGTKMLRSRIRGKSEALRKKSKGRGSKGARLKQG